MKTLAIILLFLSIFLDGTIPMFANTYFLTNLTFITLILIYPLFLKNKSLYLFLLLISTVIYDLLYTNILFFNTVLCFCIFLILEKNYKKMNFLLVFEYLLLYQLLLFSLFYTTSYTKDLFFGIKLITSTLIMNVLYTFILLILFKDKYKIKKVNYN